MGADENIPKHGRSADAPVRMAGSRTPSSAKASSPEKPSNHKSDSEAEYAAPNDTLACESTREPAMRRESSALLQGAFLDPKLAHHLEENWHARGYLPHFEKTRVIQFVTFRLGDSLPQEVLARIAAMDAADTIGRWKESEATLDRGHGSALLKNPACARIVVERLLHGHGDEYELHAWCVMPNHVHALLHVYEGHALPGIVAAWKSVSARMIHKEQPEAPRRLWQEDYFDRFIRDADHYARTVHYIHENPVKAKLVSKASDWKWNSAGARTPSSANVSDSETPSETQSASEAEDDASHDTLADEGVREPAERTRASALRREADARDPACGRGRPRSGDALLARLRAPLEARAAKSLERTLVARPERVDYTNLADNDYLGLSRAAQVIAAGKEALDRWGASSAASPLITGYTEEHAALERELAEWCGFAHGLVWNTGFAANAAVLGTLPKPGDLVLADRLIHASMISGILSSGARLMRYPHLDLEKLRELLEKHREHEGVVWVVTETVFSMDGDYPDLKKLASLKAEYGFVLVVDEAHATGWFGPTGAGLVEREGVADSVDILVGTLGKGLGGFGAYTLFHDEVFRRHLMNFAGEFVYSTYLAPSCAASARAAVRRVKEMHADEGVREPAERTRASALRPDEISRRWRAALREVVPDTPEGDSPIIPIPLGDAARVMEVSAKLLAAGWRVGAVRPPTVPEDGARLRISLRLGLDEKAPAEFAGALREALRD